MPSENRTAGRTPNDLSQSILTALCETDWEKKAIADMDGYIYRICLNTYYTRLRKAARYWECVDYDALPEQADGSKTPEEALLHRKCKPSKAAPRGDAAVQTPPRSDCAVLLRARKLSREIAERLGVPESTLRWHLGEAKHRLKERMDMTDKFYEPVRLQVYICGSCHLSRPERTAQ